MKRMMPEELSALLDGELSDERAIEVRAAVKFDPALQRELASLQQLDSRLKAAASAKGIAAPLVLPESTSIRHEARSKLSIFGAMAILLLARFVPKFADETVIVLAVQVLAGTMILLAIFRLLGTGPQTSVD